MGYASNYQIYVQEAVDLELEADDHVIRKESCWVNAGNALEIDGVPKLEIGKKLRATIETKIFEKTGQKKKINTSHFYRVIDRNGWGVHSAEERAENDDEIIPLREKSYSTSEESGDATGSDVGDGDGIQKLETADYTVENKRLTDAIEKTITSLRKASTHSKTNPVLSFVPDEVIDDYLTRVDAMADNDRDYINKKQNVPTHMQSPFLLLYYASLNTHDLFTQFYTKMKLAHMADLKKRMKVPLHKKEMKKFLAREIITLDQVLEFPDAATARIYGFYGQQCSICKGYRTKIHPTKAGRIYCVRCHPTNDTEIRRTIKKCKKCDADIDPQTAKDKLCNLCNSK